MTRQHWYETEDGERDLFSSRRKVLRRDGKRWTYSHPETLPGDIKASAIMVEPAWRHLVYQAGPKETEAWAAQGGHVDKDIGVPDLRTRAEIDRYRSLTNRLFKGRTDQRYDFGVFRRGNR